MTTGQTERTETMNVYGIDIQIQVGTTVLIKARNLDEAEQIADQMQIEDLQDLVNARDNDFGTYVVRAYGTQWDRLNELLGRLVVEPDQADELPWEEAFTYSEPVQP